MKIFLFILRPLFGMVMKFGSQPKAKEQLENCSGQCAENNAGRPTWD